MDLNTALFASFYLVGLIGYLQMYRRARSRERWSVAAGRIIESTICVGPPVRGIEPATEFLPLVRYRFTANGTDVTGDQIVLPGGDWIRDDLFARRIAARYPVGAAVRVIFDPANPRDSIAGWVPDPWVRTRAYVQAALLLGLFAGAVTGLNLRRDFAVVFALPAVYFAASAIRDFRYARSTLGWKGVDGVITISAIEQDSMGLPGDDLAPHRPNIMYSYQIGSTEHVGNRVFIAAEAWRRKPDLAVELVNRYPPGTPVRVYLDPARPDEAVLVRGRTSAAWRQVPFALFFLAAAVSWWRVMSH